MSITRRLLASREQRGATGPWGSSDVIPTNGSLGVTTAGVVVTESSTLSIIPVWACVRILAGNVSTLPIDSFTKAGGIRAEVTPKPMLLEQPWAELTLEAWLSQVMVSLLLRGNFYGFVAERDRLGYPTQIMPLHPDGVQKTRDRSSGRIVFKVNGQVVPTGDMFHIPGLMVPGALVGLNPIEYCRQGLGLTMATEAFGSQFFANGAHMAGVVTVPEDLNEEETIAMARAFAAAHSGINKAHLPAVITGGAQWTQLSVNPDDAQFLQTRQFQTSQIAMLFGVPPHMIGDVDRTTSWGTGIEAQEQGFVTNTLQTWLTSIESAITKLRPVGEYVKFNLAGRLRGVTLERYQAYTLARNGGWLNVDEIREKEEMGPLPDGLGEDYLQPLNFVVVGDAPLPAPASPSMNGQHPPAARAEPPMVNVHNHFDAPAAARAPDVHNHFEAPPPVVIPAPEVRVGAAAAPDVHVTVEAPPPAEVRVEAPVVNVAAAPAPQVTVQAPPPRARYIDRDRDGNITAIVETETV